MPSHVIIGAQWGDEAKEKVVDLYCEFVECVVRFHGSFQGHGMTRYLPDAVVSKGVQCVLASGVVIDPGALCLEVGRLDGSSAGELSIDPMASVVLPYHVILDRHRASGVSGQWDGRMACYADVKMKRAVLVRDLLDPERLRLLLSSLFVEVKPLLEFYGEELDFDEMFATLLEQGSTLAPYVKDARATIQSLLSRRKTVLFQGVDGVLLDEMTGHYPYVIPFQTTSLGVSVGTGLRSLSEAKRVTGVAKAYCTRVGPGPLPTEIVEEHHKMHLKRFGREPDDQPRRYGWLDAAALRLAIKLGGITELALTKLDALSGLETIKMNVGYQVSTGERFELPPTDVQAFFEATPLYEEMPGWSANISQVREWEELPMEAKRFLRRLEMLIECPISLVSVGDKRSETVILREGTSQVR